MKQKTNKMKFTHFFKVAVIFAMIAASVSIPYLTNRAKAMAEVPLVIRTAILSSPTGAVNPHGNATWQLYPSGNREIEIEIEDVNLAAGTSLDTVVNGNPTGQIIVDSRNRGKLKLRTDDGQAVPMTDDGTPVSVKNGDLTLISGVLSGGGPNPTPTPTGSPTPSPTGTPTASPTPTPSGTPNAGDLFAGLTGPTLNGVLPRGFANFEIHSSRVELELRIRQVNLPFGTALSVIVDGTDVGNIILENGGEGRVKFRSDNGQVIPPIVAGSTISVNNGASTILFGTFASFTGPTPTPTPTGTPAPATGRSFEANLTGMQATPPVNTAANGEIKATLNAEETQVTVFGEFHNLSSNQTGARIETTVGTTTTIRDLGVVGGTNGRFATVTFAVSAAQVQQLRAGLWSSVIDSVNNPNGEIRGQFKQRSSHSDFDGDGTHDLAVFRPSTNSFYVYGTSGPKTEIEVKDMLVSNPKVVSGDFDGDGVTDPALYKDVAGLGVWEVTRSSDSGITTNQFGLAGDTPVRGDFDGDGRLDFAVFRPSESQWYIQFSNNTGYVSVYWGIGGDLPIPSDMDGDGKDDLVVFRPSNGTWYWVRSSDNQPRQAQLRVRGGRGGEIPLRGDFDGDGKSDVATFSAERGTWSILQSSDGVLVRYRFGMSGDIPVAGDYNGDGKTDIAFFRPFSGNWYLGIGGRRTEPVPFGMIGDIPLIAP